MDRHAQGLVDSAWYTHISNWWAARQRLGRDVPLVQTQPDPRSLDWYPIALGQGVFLLWQLRREVGPEMFDRLMDEFGMAHANEEISLTQFQEFMQQSGGEKARDLFSLWFESEYNPASEIEDSWSIHSFELEPERALIVYGGGGFATKTSSAASITSLIRATNTICNSLRTSSGKSSMSASLREGSKMRRIPAR